VLDQIQQNTQARLEEAQGKAWLGEVAGLEESLRHIVQRREQALAPLERSNDAQAAADPPTQP
jgi:hypothetical protein